MPMKELSAHHVILFQGDSITDAGRNRLFSGPNSPEGMGYGYPRWIMDQFLEIIPTRDQKFYNRGVSGDRIQDLARRWPLDTLRLKPDLISILIGINDSSTYLYMGMGSSPEDFRSIYRQLLNNTLEALPATALVLCEPFALLTGQVNEAWNEDITRRQTYVNELAQEYEALFVPFQSALDNAVLEGVPPRQLLEDGIHPTERGHRLLAKFWLEIMEES